MVWPRVCGHTRSRAVLERGRCHSSWEGARADGRQLHTSAAPGQPRSIQMNRSRRKMGLLTTSLRRRSRRGVLVFMVEPWILGGDLLSAVAFPPTSGLPEGGARKGRRLIRRIRCRSGQQLDLVDESRGGGGAELVSGRRGAGRVRGASRGLADTGVILSEAEAAQRATWSGAIRERMWAYLTAETRGP